MDGYSSSVVARPSRHKVAGKRGKLVFIVRHYLSLSLLCALFELQKTLVCVFWTHVQRGTIAQQLR